MTEQVFGMSFSVYRVEPDRAALEFRMFCIYPSADVNITRDYKILRINDIDVDIFSCGIWVCECGGCLVWFSLVQSLPG